MRNKAADILLESHPATNPHDVAPRIEPHQIGIGPVGLPPRQQSRPQTPKPRASNEARAWLIVQNVTPTGYELGVFLANHARFATDGDGRRKVKPGEIFCYWPQAKTAAELGWSVRKVRRGVRSLREVGLEVRQRVRPYGASYVFPVRSGVPSGVRSGVRSHREPRTEPRKNPERTFKVSARVARSTVLTPPVKTAAPLKGSPMPSQAATDTTDGPASASALRGLRAQFKATQAKAKASRPITSPVKRTAKQAAVPEPGEAPSFKLNPDLEARFEAQDRLREEQRAKRTPPAPSAVGCPDCGYGRMIGGSCEQCGYDDGTDFSPNPDYSHGL